MSEGTGTRALGCVVRVREALDGGGDVNEVMAADDEACQLGQWLKEAERAYAALPEYQAAKDVIGQNRLPQRSTYS